MMVNSDDAREMWTAITALRDEIRTMLYGDGSDGRPGLATRLDRVEQAAKVNRESNNAMWRWVFGLIVAIVTAAATAAADIAMRK